MTLSDTDIWVFVGYFLLVILTGLGIAFLILSAVLVTVSAIRSRKASSLIKKDEEIYKTSTIFNVSAILICAFLGVLYYVFW